MPLFIHPYERKEVADSITKSVPLHCLDNDKTLFCPLDFITFSTLNQKRLFYNFLNDT